MIKAAKKALRSILGNADVTDEELCTAICGEGRLLNSRPITSVSAAINNLMPLTPNHFLHQFGGNFAPEALNDQAINPCKRWHQIQQLPSQFWKSWWREFLLTLNSRNKWFQQRRNLQKGDSVCHRAPCQSRRIAFRTNHRDAPWSGWISSGGKNEGRRAQVPATNKPLVPTGVRG